MWEYLSMKELMKVEWWELSMTERENSTEVQFRMVQSSEQMTESRLVKMAQPRDLMWEYQWMTVGMMTESMVRMFQKEHLSLMNWEPKIEVRSVTVTVCSCLRTEVR